MSSTFFSIIVPIYNTSKKYLDACVHSLTNQTFKQIEILLVDDGSNDFCAQLCDAYAEMDKRIRVIHQSNQGVSVARNNGVRESTAEWIMFVDGDDWLDLGACECLHRYLKENQCDVLQFRAISEYNKKQVILNSGLEPGKLYDTSEVPVREFLYRRVMQAPNDNGAKLSPAYYSWDKVFKRSFLIDNDLQYTAGLPKSEDKVFILSCYEKIQKLYCVQDVLYHYRINAESVCHKYTPNADVDRMNLSLLLFQIAMRMDKELGVLFGDPNYDRIMKDCYRFIFGITSDVLSLKYYHPDNPHTKKERVRAAKEFLKKEPFCTAMRKCKYSELNREAKLKKFLLGLGFVSAFCFIRHVSLNFTGKVASN